MRSFLVPDGEAGGCGKIDEFRAKPISACTGPCSPLPLFWACSESLPIYGVRAPLVPLMALAIGIV